MIYRETGQFKPTYRSDSAVFPIPQDRWVVIAFVLFLAVVVPFIGTEYLFQAILVPVLIYSIAAIGLNLLTGYCGQLSLGTGGFMAVGAVACYKLSTGFPEMNLLVVLLLSGVITAGVGLIFGIPSLRIKGFYLAVATLAAQFFLNWLFNKIAWFQNYTPSGTLTMPPREFFGVLITGAAAEPHHRYLFCLGVVVVLALAATNIVRGPAADLIGCRPFHTKLLACSVSSFYVGVAGALALALWLGSVETAEAFDINQSFQILFMIIIGGLGSMLGSFIGAAFIVLTPILLTNVMVYWFGFEAVTAKHFEFIFFGGLIIFFLIVEPHGIARLWQIAKEKLRLWPFPH